MNRTIKDATVKRYHYDTHDQLRQHLTDFVAAYTFGRRIKDPERPHTYEAICKTWLKEPHRFTSDPTHQIPGPNIYIADAVAHLRAIGEDVPDELLAHTSPVGWGHIAFSGDTTITMSLRSATSSARRSHFALSSG